MQDAQHVRQIRSIGRLLWRVTDEMVVVGEHRPGFQLPGEVSSDGEQAPMKDPEAFLAPEVVGFEISAGRDEISAPGAELMQRRVRPRWGAVEHGSRVAGRAADGEGEIGKRQRTAAVQDAGATSSPVREGPRGFELRQCAILLAVSGVHYRWRPGASLYWSSIGPLLFLYCSSISQLAAPIQQGTCFLNEPNFVSSRACGTSGMLGLIGIQTNDLCAIE